MRFMNGDNPSVEFEDGTFRVLLQVTILLSGKSENSEFEFEDGTQKGDHRGCVGCDGDMRNSFDFE